MRCEAKGPCVQQCPENVFEIRRLTDAERAALPLMSRLKVWVHGGKQGFVARPEACAGCGRCVPACPENAISLHPVRADFA
jgi:NAD-dependent dihydropyrimidine dehydrogenase PreA subunit